ncbi:conserved hypothetical protein, secreted [Candidatus Magnetomorum sp. HK-1]|nr:conserved hypothetical protein, secreted [Candidatus Magnetomorum sp. HK-1]
MKKLWPYKKLKKITKHLILISNICLLLILSCTTADQTKFIKNGVQYCKDRGTFSGRWHDFYERGLSCMEGEFYPEALFNFEKALNKRPDRVEDQRMTRKYGTRFIDYFPHREKGIIYYLLGKYMIAEKELERSLVHEPSEKAFLFLDKVRKCIMRSKGEAIVKPDLEITFNGKHLINGQYQTSEKILFIQGIASCSQYISDIFINDKAILIQKSDTKVHFSYQLALDQGCHPIDIMAKSLNGETKHETVIVQVDREGPWIVLSSLDNKGQVSGYIQDDSGLLSLAVDQKPVQIISKKYSKFSFMIEKEQKECKLVATDQLGNSSMLLINQTLKETFTQLFSTNNDENIIDSSPPISAKIYHMNSPKIHLYGWKEKNTVYTDSVTIEGVVLNPNKLNSLYINHKEIYGKSEKVYNICKTIQLKVGENKILIKATDINMNHIEKSFVIIRETPEFEKIIHRCSLYFSPINEDIIIAPQHHLWDQIISWWNNWWANESNVMLYSNQLPDQFQQFLISDFVKQQRFRMVHTEDHSNIKNSQFLMQGYIVKTRLGIEIILRLIATNTGKICCIKDAFIENPKNLKKLAKRISKKFHQEFKIVKGKIHRLHDKTYSVTPETSGQVLIKWPLLCFRTKEVVKNPVTGKILGKKYWITGKGFVSEVGINHFFITCQNSVKILVDDGVITQ